MPENTDMAKTRSARAAKSRTKEEASELGVGERLRRVRETVGLSQRELAKRSGITNATISLIEQEAHAPSLASLHKILLAIPISLADFFAIPTSRKNVLFNDPDELTVVARGPMDLRVLASERRDKSLQLFLEHYEPGASTGKEPLVHDGETAALVIEGVVEVEADGEVRRIEAGGGYHVIGREPYRLRNVGDSVAVVVCAVTPPYV